MRELKFRCVYKSESNPEVRFIDATLDDIEDKDMMYGPFRMVPEWIEEGYQWVETNQFTGLKDKNGKEIYEGGIIKYKELIPSENKIQKLIQGADYVYLEFVGEVVWDDEGASFDVDGGTHGYRGFGARGSVEYEVIGNIYENSDMLPKAEPMITWCEHGKMLVCEECAKRPRPTA